MSSVESSGWRVPMVARDTGQEHRSSTPLELLFDLCFVVAVAQAASRLHHALAENHLAEALIGYPMVFFAIWWAWMNFTWFASAYDTDDVPYRLAVLVQIAGALILAAGVERAFDDRNFAVMTIGYVVMRSALIALWVRAGRANPEARPATIRYAVGVAACQVGWLVLLVLPEGLAAAGFVVGVVAELLVPVWAERVCPTSWHPGHITERYGLFTLIVLGESVLAATTSVSDGLDAHEPLAGIGTIAGGGVLIIFAMWWLYFDQPTDERADRARREAEEESTRTAFAWGYGHYPVFASAAALGAGLELAVDRATDHSALTGPFASATVTIPVAVFLLSVWLLHRDEKAHGFLRTATIPIAVVLVLATTWLGQPVLATGILLAGLVTVSVVIGHHVAGAEPAPAERPPTSDTTTTGPVA